MPPPLHPKPPINPASPSAISTAFTTHKNKILSALAVPESDYTDLSPKGSIDAPIRDLIDAINALDGVVTTSSCSGRVAVFVQGGGVGAGRGPVNPGGKGFDGHWLFVSHEPMAVDSDGGKPIVVPEELRHLVYRGSEHYEVLGETTTTTSTIEEDQDLSTTSGTSRSGVDTESNASKNAPRLINLSFEPLILHICCASLAHAKPILALALDAGFRESGVQSLKCLDHEGAWPMVAIRSAGLAFSTVVGVVAEDGMERGIVGGDVLRFLLGVANDRFVENGRRTERVRNGVEELLRRQRGVVLNGTGDGETGGRVWEDKDARARRKKAEGLRRQDAKQEEKLSQHSSETTSSIEQEEYGLGLGLNDE